MVNKHHITYIRRALSNVVELIRTLIGVKHTNLNEFFFNFYPFSLINLSK